MAEQSVNFEENNLISFLNSEQNVDETVQIPNIEMNLGAENDNSLNDMIAAEQIMDEQPDHNILSTVSDQDQINKDSIETSDLPINEHGPEVESPTTGEAFTFKCVFCEQILTFSDGPKLLECLHNSCSNCISNKLYDQSIGVSARGKFSVSSFIGKISNESMLHICFYSINSLSLMFHWLVIMTFLFL